MWRKLLQIQSAKTTLKICPRGLPRNEGQQGSEISQKQASLPYCGYNDLQEPHRKKGNADWDVPKTEFKINEPGAKNEMGREWNSGNIITAEEEIIFGYEFL